LKLIVVVGMPGSGKSTCIEAMKSLGLPVVCMGDVVREEVRRRGLEPSPQSFAEVAQDLRRRYGPAAIAMLTAEKIRSLDAPAIIVDGVRSLDEVEYFRRNVSEDIVIVAVHASPRTRFERLRRRGREDDPRTWEEFVERDMRELGWGIGSVIALADHMIVNEGSLEELHEKCRTVAKTMKESQQQPQNV